MCRRLHVARKYLPSQTLELIAKHRICIKKAVRSPSQERKAGLSLCALERDEESCVSAAGVCVHLQGRGEAEAAPFSENM